MAVTYEQARSDHEYLWDTYGPASDMTGGYVDSDDLERLLRKPTKVTAREVYHDQILYWLGVGPERKGVSREEHRRNLERAVDDRKVRRIAYRHGEDLSQLEQVLVRAGGRHLSVIGDRALARKIAAGEPPYEVHGRLRTPPGMGR